MDIDVIWESYMKYLSSLYAETWQLSDAEVGRVPKNCTQVKVKVLVEIFTQVKVKVIVWIVTWVRVKKVSDKKLLK